MRFTTLTAFVAAGLASAAPTASSTKDVKAFNLMTLRSASPIHFGSVSASQSNIFVNLQGKQGATCDADAHNKATFSLRKGALYLYNKGTKEEQQVYVDRSGMGQGNVGYISPGQKPPRNAELTGWTSKPSGEFSYLNFAGAGLIACPATPEGSWSVWVDVNDDTPGGSEGCLGFQAMVQPNEKPVSCTYT